MTDPTTSVPIELSQQDEADFEPDYMDEIETETGPPENEAEPEVPPELRELDQHRRPQGQFQPRFADPARWALAIMNRHPTWRALLIARYYGRRPETNWSRRETLRRTNLILGARACQADLVGRLRRETNLHAALLELEGIICITADETPAN